MQWLNKIVDEVIAHHPDGEILIETGGSPSGTHHLGHMREIVTADAITLELHKRDREARLIYFVDDLDALRKIPVNVPVDFDQYLGMPLCDVPAPDGSDQSYADYFLLGLIEATKSLNIDIEFIRSHLKYRDGYFVPAIETSLEKIDKVRHALETVAGRQLDEQWSPIQVMEGKYLKKRELISINKETKEINYEDGEGDAQTVNYDKGQVKLDWRLDFPARWWLQNVACEPSGRDHTTKGGSVQTGQQICREVFEAEPPYMVPYDFINMAGDNKKMSASRGTGLDAVEGSQLMPPEVLRYFILRSPPSKRLYFDPINGVVKLIDEFAAFAAKGDRTEDEEQLLYVSTRGIEKKTVSRVPFSHLVASYQASLKDADKTLEVIRRTEYAQIVDEDAEIIKAELKYIDEWLKKWAPEDIKFSLRESVDAIEFSEQEQKFLKELGDKVVEAPENADGTWFHEAIYGLRDESGLEPKAMFETIYKAIIGKTSGPRAGYFLSILPRDWLIKRLNFET